jgi:hypothetical protein
MSEKIYSDKNCHAYCHYRKQCRYAKGETGIDPEDCAMYWRIDDIVNGDGYDTPKRRKDDDYDDFD